jgi:peptide/nickel transport system substrate-binding protein
MSPEAMNPRDFLALTYAYARRHAQAQMVSRRGFLAAAAGAGVLALGGGAMAQAPRRGGILRAGRDQEPDSLDPHKTSLAVAEGTMRLVHEPLARTDPDGNVVPALAESWELANGNKTIVFKLKDGVTFHDGTPVDAEAVVWTVARHRDPATASPTVFLLGPIEKVEAVDRMTVAYTYRQPFVPVWVGLTLGYCGILPRRAVEAGGVQYGRAPVGAGPFKMKSWSADGGIQLDRYDGYRAGAAPNVDGVKLVHYPEDATRMAALETGEIDLIYSGSSVPLTGIRRLRGRRGIEVLGRPALTVRTIIFNQRVAPMDNLKVRQALSHAVDPARMVALILDGQGKPAFGPLPSTMPGYAASVEQLAYRYDPARARALLAEAGHGSGLRLNAIGNDTPVMRRAAEITQAQFREVGVELAVQTMPIGEWSVAAQRGQTPVVFGGYSYPDPDILHATFHSTGGLNYGFIPREANAELDRLVEAQRVEFDPARRRDILKDAQEKIVRDADWVPLFEPLNFAATGAKVKGAVLQSNGDINIARLWLEE